VTRLNPEKSLCDTIITALKTPELENLCNVRVKQRLEAKAHATYIDDEAATAGVAWRDKLQGALRRCDGIVVLLTQNAINSPYVGVAHSRINRSA